MSEQTSMEFEREKWRADYELRKREIELKEREQARSRWSNPIVLAVLAAALAGLGNAAATWLNGIEQRKLESERAASPVLITSRMRAASALVSSITLAWSRSSTRLGPSLERFRNGAGAQ